MTIVQISPKADSTLWYSSDGSGLGTNTGNGPILYTYYNVGATLTSINRTVLSFDIPSEVQNGTINSCILNLYRYAYNGINTVYELTRSFTELGVSWNNCCGAGTPWITPGGDFNLTPLDSDTGIANTWSMFNIPKLIITGKTEANFIIRQRDEGIVSGGACRYISKDANATNPIAGADLLKPYLYIDYVPSGICVPLVCSLNII